LSTIQLDCWVRFNHTLSKPEEQSKGARVNRPRDIPVQYVVECFELTESGVLLWKERPASHFTMTAAGAARWATRFAGTPAGQLNQNGYVLITLTYQRCIHKLGAHRIVWALAHGEWPKQHIDHINRVRSDNRLVNLRDVSHTENMRNATRSVKSRTTLLGAYRGKRGGFRSQINRAGKITYLGSFPTEMDAHLAFLRASALLDSPLSGE
jgi:hypothetical protein